MNNWIKMAFIVTAFIVLSLLCGTLFLFNVWLGFKMVLYADMVWEGALLIGLSSCALLLLVWDC